MNKTLKKSLSALLALVMILSCIPLSGTFASEDATVETQEETQEETIDYLAAFESAVLANSGTDAYTIDNDVDLTDTSAVKAAVQEILESAHAELLKTWDSTTMLTTGVSITYYDIISVVQATEYEDGSVVVKISYKDDTTDAQDTSAHSVEATFIVSATGTTSADRFAEFESAVLAQTYTISKDVDSTDTAALKAAVQEILEDECADLLSTFDVDTYITTGIKITYYDIVEVVAATESESGSVTVKVSYKDESSYATDTSAQSVEVTFVLEQATIDRTVEFEAVLVANSGTDVYTIDKSVDATDTAAVKAAVQAILESEHADLLSTWDSTTYLTTGIKITYYDIIETTLAADYEAGSVTVKVSYKDESTYAADTSAKSVEVTFILEATGATSAERFAEFEEVVLADTYTISKDVDSTDTAALKAAVQEILEDECAELLSTFDVDTYITTGIKITYFDILEVVAATEAQAGSVTVKVSYKDNSTYATDTSAQAVEVTFVLEQATIDRTIEFEAALVENSGTAVYTIDSSVDATDTSALKAAIQEILEDVLADYLYTYDSATGITTGIKITYYDIVETTLAQGSTDGSVTVKVSFKDNSTYAADTSAKSAEVVFILEAGLLDYSVVYTDGMADISITVPWGSKVTQTQEYTVLNELEYDGYIFLGWLSSADGEIYQSGDIFTMPDSNVVLTAQWEIDPITQEEIDASKAEIEAYEFDTYATDTTQEEIETAIDEIMVQISKAFEIGTLYQVSTVEYIAPTTAAAGSFTFYVTLVGTDVTTTTEEITVEIEKIAITQTNVEVAVALIEIYDFGSFDCNATQDQIEAAIQSAISIKISPVCTYGLHYSVVAVDFAASTSNSTGYYTFEVVVTGDDIVETTTQITIQMPITLDQVTLATYSCTYDAIRINWNSVSNAEGYRIYMYVDGQWETVDTVSSSTTTYRISGLDANTEYLFKVKAYDRDDNGEAVWAQASDEYVTSTKTSQVSMTTYTYTYDAIRLNWNATSGADGYRIYMLVDGSWETVATVSSSTITYRLSGLDANTEYSFKVKAYVRNDAGVACWLDASDEYVTSTKTSQVSMTTYTCTYDAIRLNWNKTSDADGYRIYMLVDGSWETVATVSSSTTTYRISGLDANTEYSFKVKAYVRNDDGVACWLDASDEYEASTKTSQVTMTTYTSTDSAVRINWSATSDADGYRVYMLIDGQWISVATLSSSTLTYKVTGLEDSSEYSFKVKAYVRNAAGDACWLDASDEFAVYTK